MRARALLSLLFAAPAAPAAGAPAAVAVNQNNAHNIARVIEQRSAVVHIDTAHTATRGATTVTEIVRIGPDPAPVVVSQTGRDNTALTFQQGRDPRVRLEQSGTVDRAVTIQREMP